MKNDNENEAENAVRRRRARRVVRPLMIGGAVVALMLGGVWLARAPLAENLIQRELAARNVRMRYQIVSIGPRTQRIENIVLGDPADPDLSARWVEVDIKLSGLTPGVAAVRAGGVRLKGAVRDGTLSLGELDKFLGQGESTETILPDIRVMLSDVRASIATDQGRVGAVVEGRGNLRNGFDGRAVLAMPRMRAAACGGERILADMRITMRDGSPRLRGPVTAFSLGCPQAGVAMARPRVDLDTRIDPRFTRIDGSARLTAAALRAADLTLSSVNATVRLGGNAEAFRGRGQIGGRTVSGAGMVAGESTLAIRFEGGAPKAARAGMRMSLGGDVVLADLHARSRDPLGRVARASAGTPVAPLVSKLAVALREAGQGNRLSASFAAQSGAGRGEATLSDIHFAATSGARIDLPAGSRLTMAWPDSQWAMTGDLSVGGGGLPQASLRLSPRRGGGFSGLLTTLPYAAANARLALRPLRVDMGADGRAVFWTGATIDGPLADGMVRGVSMNLSGSYAPDGTWAINRACTPLRWQALRVSSFALDAAALNLCPADGTAMIGGGRRGLTGGLRSGNVALAGTLGKSAVTLRAAELALGVARTDLRASRLEVRIGGQEAPVILGVDSLTGAMAPSGLSGRFAGGHGRIGTVPFDLTQMSGDWRFARGTLAVDGRLRLSDTASAAR
ncbi:MAG: exoprotein, partial [Sphingobium sp.]